MAVAPVASSLQLLIVYFIIMFVVLFVFQVVKFVIIIIIIIIIIKSWLLMATVDMPQDINLACGFWYDWLNDLRAIDSSGFFTLHRTEVLRKTFL